MYKTIVFSKISSIIEYHIVKQIRRFVYYGTYKAPNL